MDRTYPCGGCDVGSIPTGSTRKIPKGIFILLPEKSPGGLFVRNRSPFEPKIYPFQAEKILAKRCTEAVSFEFPT